MGLYVGALGIGEVGLVCSSHARYSTELLPPDTFSDSFLKLSEKSRRGVRRGLSEHRSGAIRPVFGPVYRPNQHSELRSNPFSDSFMANFGELSFHALG